MTGRKFLCSVWLALALVAGCSGRYVPEVPDLGIVYKIDVQQGNVVTQEMLAQLQRGMEKKKVRFIMGTPIVMDTFHADRWDYIYTFHKGGSGDTERRHVSLVFVGDKLDRLEGDVKPALGTLVVDTRQDTTVAVPNEYKKGLFTKLKDTMPFAGEEQQDAGDDAAQEKSGAGKEQESASEPPKTAATSGDEADRANGENTGADQGSGQDRSSGEAHEGDAAPDTAAGEDRDDETGTGRDEAGATNGRARGEEVVVPEDAPHKEKGFFRRMLGKIGVGKDEDDEREEEYDPGDPRYRDPTDPDER